MISRRLHFKYTSTIFNISIPTFYFIFFSYTQQQSSEVVPDDGPTYAPTCARIYESGYTYSGDYTIDPDGRGKKPPFTVYCDMDSGDGKFFLIYINRIRVGN